MCSNFIHCSQGIYQIFPMIEKSNIWHSAIKIHKLDHCSYDCCKRNFTRYPTVWTKIFTKFSSKRFIRNKMYTKLKLKLKKKKKSLAEKEEEDNSGCGKQKQNVSIKTTQAEDPLLKKTVALSEKGTHNYNTTEFVINQQIGTEVIKSHLRVNISLLAHSTGTFDISSFDLGQTIGHINPISDKTGKETIHEIFFARSIKRIYIYAHGLAYPEDVINSWLVQSKREF